MNIGAALNLLFVRAGCKPLMARWCKNRLARLQLDVIEYMLREAPLRIVILLRLPVIASGILNYMFSLSDTLPMGPYVLGNLIGNIPGTLLFSLLGTMVRSIGKAILNGDPQPTALAVACVILVVVVAVIVVMALLVRRTLRKMKEDRRIGETVEPEAIVTVDIATPTVDASGDAPSETHGQATSV